MPQGVMAAADNATVNATVTDYSSITATNDQTSWNLLRGANNRPIPTGINVTVDSSTPWSTAAKDKNQVVGSGIGHMKATVSPYTPLTDAFYLNSLPLTSEVPLVSSGAAQGATSIHYPVSQFVQPGDDTQYIYTIVITVTLTST
jgi:hypothetical protein